MDDKHLALDYSPTKMVRKASTFSLLIAIFAYIGLIPPDPATSPFYAIESALGTVGYSLIVPTMLFVIAVAVSVQLGISPSVSASIRVRVDQA